jgi:hypothetical protein
VLTVRYMAVGLAEVAGRIGQVAPVIQHEVKGLVLQGDEQCQRNAAAPFSKACRA